MAQQQEIFILEGDTKQVGHLHGMLFHKNAVALRELSPRELNDVDTSDPIALFRAVDAWALARQEAAFPTFRSCGSEHSPKVEVASLPAGSFQRGTAPHKALWSNPWNPYVDREHFHRVIYNQITDHDGLQGGWPTWTIQGDGDGRTYSYVAVKTSCIVVNFLLDPLPEVPQNDLAGWQRIFDARARAQGCAVGLTTYHGWRPFTQLMRSRDELNRKLADGWTIASIHDISVGEGRSGLVYLLKRGKD